MKAVIFEIKRFAVHDGDGIRTTVFFKGCPLKCLWCHNPEGIDFAPQTAFYAHKCIGCVACRKAGFTPENCLGDARAQYGEEVTVAALLPRLLEDREFFEASGGGVTLSGGECLMQADFCRELLRELKNRGIHTAVDTCGFVPRAALEKVMDFSDVFLYDIKAFDEDVHIRCTGQSNGIILKNLVYLDDAGKDIEIRIPYVPGCNDDQMEKIARFLAERKHITKIRILPYHDYARGKYEALGMADTLPAQLPTAEELDAVRELLRTVTGFPVCD